MSAREHTGQYIQKYNWEVADPHFGMPADSMFERKGVSLERHDLGDARMTTIRSPRIPNMRYLRFFDLAKDIPSSERETLGFPSYPNSYSDLVVACPQNFSDGFKIVPSEPLHHSGSIVRIRQRSLIRKWATLQQGKYNPGIYLHNAETSNLVDISKQVPATVEACLSVAGLLAMRSANNMLGR